MTSIEGLIASLYKIGAIQFGEFKLKSGQTSHIYINLRKIISYPNILKDVADNIWDVIARDSFDLLCGVPYTALPMATCLSLTHSIPMIMRRKEKKEYGTKQMIEGEFKSGQTVMIIEDVITTGSSILETAADLEEAGLIVREVVALIDREQGGKENLSKKYFPKSVFTLSKILETLLQSDFLSLNERKLVEQFLLKRSA